MHRSDKTLGLWSGELCTIQAQLQCLFGHASVAASAAAFLDGLLGPEQRKTGWMRAEAAGDPGPWRQQAVLGRSRWDADALRDLFQLPTSFVRGAGWMSGRIRPNGMAPRPLAPRWLGEVPMARDANAWIDREIAGCRFADERLGQRLRALLVRMAGAMGGSIPLACQDWANTKAAYRFFSNDRVSEGGDPRPATSARPATGPPASVARSWCCTTRPSSPTGGERPERVGQTCRVNSGRDKQGRYRQHTVCGLLMHSSLAVTAEGLPLGLGGREILDAEEVQGHRRPEAEDQSDAGAHRAARRASGGWTTCASPPLLFGEPERCVHIGDRESDIYELFCLAQELGTHFLVRSCVDRLRGTGRTRSAGAMDEVPVQGRHRVEVRDDKGAPDTAVVELSYRSLRILPPIGKQKRYPALTLTVLHARGAGGAGPPAPHRLEADHRLARPLEPGRPSRSCAGTP